MPPQDTPTGGLPPTAVPRATTRPRPRDDSRLAIVLSLFVHLAAGSALYAAEDWFDRDVVRDVPIDVEIVPPTIEPPPPPPPPPPPQKLAPPPTEAEPSKQKKTPRTQPRQVRRQPTRTPPRVETPAPGENTNDDAPARVIQLPNPGVGGTGPPVATGRPKSRNVGTGGTGTNTGGGGPPESKGTGPPKPMSIAAIKRKALAINNVDTKGDYPPTAKRLGVEGKIKVKLIVDAKGRVVDRVPLNRLGHGLDEYALRLALKLRFKPAIDTNDRPVASSVIWTFTFEIPD